MPTWIQTGAWLASLGVCYFVANYVEQHAAMRGTKRRPLPAGVDKALRLFFLAVLVGPLAVSFPWYVIPPVLLYTPTFIDGSERQGRPSNFVKNWTLWRWLKWYFSLELVYKEKLDPKRQYIIGIHPHGFLPFGTVVNMSTTVSGIAKYLNGVELRTLAASFCFYLPGYRDLILAGGVIDAARYNARRALDAGKSLALVPGGATEGLYATPGDHTLVLKNRKGFVKLAIETGAYLVPAFSFGETNCYTQIDGKKWRFVKTVQRKWQAITGLSLPLVTNIFPRAAKITTVIGAPIPVVKNPVPTDAEVDALLQTYIEALSTLFHNNAAKYIADPKARGLNII